jgi:hypothetical protein
MIVEIPSSVDLPIIDDLAFQDQLAEYSLLREVRAPLRQVSDFIREEEGKSGPPFVQSKALVELLLSRSGRFVATDSITSFLYHGHAGQAERVALRHRISHLRKGKADLPIIAKSGIGVAANVSDLLLTRSQLMLSYPLLTQLGMFFPSSILVEYLGVQEITTNTLNLVAHHIMDIRNIFKRNRIPLAIQTEGHSYRFKKRRLKL